MIQVLPDIGGIHIGLACQLRIRGCASVVDGIGDGRVDRITGNQILISGGYGAVVIS